MLRHQRIADTNTTDSDFTLQNSAVVNLISHIILLSEVINEEVTSFREIPLFGKEDKLSLDQNLGVNKTLVIKWSLMKRNLFIEETRTRKF